MLGNLAKECGVTERLNKTMQNELMNIVTIFLGIAVGATATASTFLTVRTLEIIAMGIVAFGMGTAGGVLLAKLMNKLSGGKINPLIGSAGVSAVPMAARVSQKEGQKANPANFLLMHAMGPNVAALSALPSRLVCCSVCLADNWLNKSAVRWKRIQRIRSGAGECFSASDRTEGGNSSYGKGSNYGYHPARRPPVSGRDPDAYR